ncbi:MAG: ShlB/FhaC/HecB family hemolysin secretion/activation protein [Pseudomonadota bacterium]
MKFLPFSPEVVRLRRMAKACQAGEVSRHEYRESRRSLIEGLSVLPNIEDTIPRFDREVTQRRAYATPFEGPAMEKKEGVSWWWLIVALLFAVLLPGMVFAASTTKPDSEVIDSIEPVAQRDPNPLHSKRLDVRQLQWVVPAAVAQELSQDDVDKFLDQALTQKKQANAPAGHGFTHAELEEVARLLSALGIHERDTQLTKADLQDLHAVVTEQKQRRGVSVVQLQEVAQALEEKVHEAGFGLAIAYVPAQKVKEGLVEIHVQLGALADVVVRDETGQPRAEARGLRSRFGHLLGRVVRSDALESELNRLNRIPGMTAQGKFVPGEEVGETVLELNVTETNKFIGAAQIDNYGYEPTGESRLALSGRWNNPRGVGDSVSANLVVGLESADQAHTAVSYTSPVLDGRFDGAIQIHLGNLDVDAGSGVHEGDLARLEAGLGSAAILTRSKSHELYFGAGVQELDWQPEGASNFEQRSWYATAQYRTHRLWDTARVALRGGLNMHAGRMDTTRFDADRNFFRLGGDVGIWTVIGTPLERLGYQAVAKGSLTLRGQLTNSALPATLRLAATGPQANRGFGPGLGYDDGLTLHGRVQFDHEAVAWWMFVDTGYGEQHRLADEWFHQTSVGLGLETELGRWQQGRLSTRLSIGIPVAQQSSFSGEQPGIDDDVQVFWSLRYAP